ncbi:hypothetical protein GIB67_042000 [Kingdonia uniflora]|uniref:Protein LURP-one-related 8 n=1 Tax=Kingdonia uniflora TaxID=39325 RepID=A0A7J7NZR6_9MAGN|nr:hypothetical protein GIB67_042000 [Kingdonia uniflora]
MPKVYPNAIVSEGAKKLESDLHVETLTVWRKSLLFNCNGFTVFDAKGNLYFRVDNYVAGHKGEIILMDGGGRSLLTLRRKRLGLGDTWVVFDGETTVNPRYLIRKNISLLKSKTLAQVLRCGHVVYEIEGSYQQRCCAVVDEKKRRVAEIKRKEAVAGASFGVDVFRLIVQPDLDPTVAMTIVISLEQMFGSKWY